MRRISPQLLIDMTFLRSLGTLGGPRLFRARDRTQRYDVGSPPAPAAAFGEAPQRHSPQTTTTFRFTERDEEAGSNRTDVRAQWTQHKGPAANLRRAFAGGSWDHRFLAGAFLAVVFLAGAFLAADFFAAVLAVLFFAGAFLAADFFAAVLVVAFFAGAFFAAVFFAAVLVVAFFAGAFFAAVFLAEAAVVFLAVLLDAAFFAPRVAPPRPRSSTPDSFKTPCTNPKERPASSAIFRMLSPAAYRLAYWEASVVRCAPVMREPLANALATAPPFVVGHRNWTTTLPDRMIETPRSMITHF
jgi:hypothetical protein